MKFQKMMQKKPKFQSQQPKAHTKLFVMFATLLPVKLILYICNYSLWFNYCFLYFANLEYGHHNKAIMAYKYEFFSLIKLQMLWSFFKRIFKACFLCVLFAYIKKMEKICNFKNTLEYRVEPKYLELISGYGQTDRQQGWKGKNISFLFKEKNTDLKMKYRCWSVSFFNYFLSFFNAKFCKMCNNNYHQFMTM